VPWLVHNSSCSSALEITNLGDREVAAEVEAHKSSGALLPLAGDRPIPQLLKPGAHAKFGVQSVEEMADVWVRVREQIPSPELSPVLAIRGITECIVAGELRTTSRDVARPTANPWFTGPVNQGDNRILALINASERPAHAIGCYSAGVMVSVPRNDRASPLTPVCSETLDEWIPPNASRQFPVSRDGNSDFSLSARGDAIVLQMLRPASATVRTYRVESTIVFGKEVPAEAESPPGKR